MLLGNGDGTFQPGVGYVTGVDALAQPNSLAIADLSGDGNADVVVAGFSGEVAVLLGNGDGTFQPGVIYTGEYYTFSATIADVNGDGKPDLLVSGWDNEYNGLLGVLIGNGDGSFQPVVSYSTGPGESFAESVAVADLNGDGKTDGVVANYDGTVGVLLGNGDGTFQPAITYNSGGYSYSVAVSDVNGDGKPDVLVADLYGYGEVGVLLGNGDGTFQPVVSYYLDQADDLAVADLNGDGKPDLVVTNGSVGVLLNNNGAPATTTLLTASVNPVNPNKVVTYTATVNSQSGASLGGSVTFNDSGAVIATVPLVNNQAVLSTKYGTRETGAHLITARYSGVFDQASGSQSGTLTEYVRSVTTKTVLTTSGSPSKVGQPVTFTATVTAKPKYGPIPDGELVTFLDNTTVIGTGATSGGVATLTTSSLSAKTHTIKATYAGDDTF